MQREITLKDFEKTVNSVDDIEPLILKRENKEDLLVISLEQHQKEMFSDTLDNSTEDYNDGKVYSARTIFKGLREKYGY